MSLYYTPPTPPRPSLLVAALLQLNHGLDLARGRLQRMSGEYWLAAAGVLVAHGMVVAFYLILVDNMVHIESQRAALAQHTQEHHRCEMLAGRLARSQCLIALKLQEEVASAPIDKQVDNQADSQTNSQAENLAER